MKAASRQGNMTVEKLNGDMNRRPSYPGELRAKHANMSTKIWVKVAMAIAYFLCVSVAAFILVIYYVFFWTPGKADNITVTPNQNPNQNVCLAKPWLLLQHARTHALNKWLHTPDTRLRRRWMDGWMRDDGTQTDMTASRVWDADWGPEGGQSGAGAAGMHQCSACRMQVERRRRRGVFFPASPQHPALRGFMVFCFSFHWTRLSNERKP